MTGEDGDPLLERFVAEAVVTPGLSGDMAAAEVRAVIQVSGGAQNQYCLYGGESANNRNLLWMRFWPPFEEGVVAPLRAK